MIITQSLILNYLLFSSCVGDFVDFHAPQTDLQNSSLSKLNYDYYTIINFKLSPFCFCVGDFVDFHAPMYILHAHIAYHEPRTHATNDK